MIRQLPLRARHVAQHNNEGRPFGRRERLNLSGYPQGPVAFFEYIDRWRRSGAFEGLAFAAAPGAAGNAA